MSTLGHLESWEKNIGRRTNLGINLLFPGSVHDAMLIVPISNSYYLCSTEFYFKLYSSWISFTELNFNHDSIYIFINLQAQTLILLSRLNRRIIKTVYCSMSQFTRQISMSMSSESLVVVANLKQTSRSQPDHSVRTWRWIPSPLIVMLQYRLICRSYGNIVHLQVYTLQKGNVFWLSGSYGLCSTSSN